MLKGSTSKVAYIFRKRSNLKRTSFEKKFSKFLVFDVENLVMLFFCDTSLIQRIFSTSRCVLDYLGFIIDSVNPETETIDDHIV